MDLQVLLYIKKFPKILDLKLVHVAEYWVVSLQI